MKKFYSSKTFLKMAGGSCTHRSGTALLIKLRRCFNKHNGKEQNSRNNAT